MDKLIGYFSAYFMVKICETNKSAKGALGQIDQEEDFIERRNGNGKNYVIISHSHFDA